MIALLLVSAAVAGLLWVAHTAPVSAADDSMAVVDAALDHPAEHPHAA